MQNQPNPNEISARELYNACISKNRRACTQGYENLRRYVYSSARYLVNTRQDAEDLAQIVLIRIYDRIDQLKTPDAFKGWIRQILRNAFIDWIKENPPHSSIDEVSDFLEEPNFDPVESSDGPIKQLFNASEGKKTKWAWIGRYHYGLQDRDLARVEGLLCEKSVSGDTMFVARSKTKIRWSKETNLVDLLLEAKFLPIASMDSDSVLQELFQQILITENWPLLYEAPLDKGSRWAWIGLHIYEMSDKDLVRVENLLCNSSLGESVMSIRRMQSRGNLVEYLTRLQDEIA